MGEKVMKTDEILTKRQEQIAEGYVDGLIGKQIADKLHISYKTVDNHTQNIYRKIGIPGCKEVRRSLESPSGSVCKTNFGIEL